MEDYASTGDILVFMFIFWTLFVLCSIIIGAIWYMKKHKTGWDIQYHDNDHKDPWSGYGTINDDMHWTPGYDQQQKIESHMSGGSNQLEND
jgi:hypothetical protein